MHFAGDWESLFQPLAGNGRSCQVRLGRKEWKCSYIQSAPQLQFISKKADQKLVSFQLELSAYSHMTLGAPHLINNTWYSVSLEQFIYLIYLLLLMTTGFFKWEKISKYPANEKSFVCLFKVSSKNCSFIILPLSKGLPSLFPSTDQFSLWWIHHILKTKPI